MPQNAKACRDSLIHVLETTPGQFTAVARQTCSLPGMPLVREYSDAELEQLNTGFIRILLEAARDQPPKIRALFMDHAIPSFVREGDTAAGILRWNASYLVLMGSALVASMPSEHRASGLAWFSSFSGTYLAEVLQAALRARSAST